MPPTASPNTVILLAQPERDDRELYVAYLRQLHFLPVMVSMADDALTLAPQADLIVTDTLLPGSLDGVAFVSRLKSAARTKAIPIIMLTSCAWPSERDRAYAAGCDVFLAKPCVPDLFVSEIRRLLARQHRAAPPTRAS